MKTVTNIISGALTAASSLLAIAALATAANFVSANAHAGEAVPTVVVHYADLNLDNAQGAATLLQRIQTAARSVCRGDNERVFEQIALRQSCLDKAVSGAVRQINIDSLSAYYSAKTGHVVANLASAR